MSKIEVKYTYQCDLCEKLVEGIGSVPTWEMAIRLGGDEYYFEVCRDCVKDCSKYQAKIGARSWFKKIKGLIGG